MRSALRWSHRQVGHFARSAGIVAVSAAFAVSCSDDVHKQKVDGPTPVVTLSDALTFEGLTNGSVNVCLDGTSKPSGVFRVRNTANAPVRFALDFAGMLVSPSATLLQPGDVSIVKVELIDIP